MDGLLSISSGNGLAARWRQLRDVDPSVTLATAACRLDVVEAELVAALCGEGVLRLDAPFGDVVRILPHLGRVRAVTRNAHATIETRGVYPPPEVGCAGVAGRAGVPPHERARVGAHPGVALHAGVRPRRDQAVG